MSGRSSPGGNADGYESIRGGTSVGFEVAGGRIAVVDPIERKRVEFRTSPSVSADDVCSYPSGSVPAPVDEAVSLSVDALREDGVAIATVRDGDFNQIDHLAEGANAYYPDGEYVVDVSGTIKIYLYVVGELSITADENTVFRFGDDATVVLAARSKHDRPASVVTTTGDPEDVMSAVSTFGSALKTTSPERSWPTLRGHPPAVELGDELSIPRGLEPPCPEIALRIPRDLRYVYTVSPLAYYLGARVEPAAEGPEIVTESGLQYRFDDDGFEHEVERLLKRIVFLEILTRKGGLFEFDLYERNEAMSDQLSIDLESLYDAPPSARLSTYLHTDHDAISKHIPNWELDSHVGTGPSQVEILPFLIRDLATIKPRSPTSMPGAPYSEETLERAREVEDFFRSPTPSDSSGVGSNGDAVHIDSDGDALETVWTGDGTPFGASKASLTAFLNQISRQPSDPPIDVAVVCNDPEMTDELDVEATYSEGKRTPNVVVHRDLSRVALRTLVENQSTEFVHYIGHATPDGVQCSDGYLDLETIPTTGIEAFLLNACESYDQGLALIDAGAVAGVSTRRKVPNATAVRVGRAMAGLLDAGFPIRAAVDVAGKITTGDYHTVIGDGGHAIAHRDNAIGTYYTLAETRDDDVFEVSCKGYPINHGIGSVFHPYHDAWNYHLIGNTTPSARLHKDEIRELLQPSDPVRILDGRSRELYWGDETLEERLF